MEFIFIGLIIFIIIILHNIDKVLCSLHNELAKLMNDINKED